MNGQLNAMGRTSNPQPKSVFINQLEGGYTINLQGNNFYPTKVCVTFDEVTTIIGDFLNSPESLPSDAPQTSQIETPENSGEGLLA